METETLGNQEIEAYKTILKEPQVYGLKMKPFNEYFSECEKVTAQHELAAQFRTVNHAVPKFIVYLLLVDFWGYATEIDEKGNLGYRLTFKQ